MAERGLVSGLDFRMGFPAPPQQSVANQQFVNPFEQPIEVDVPDYANDPLAVREKLTSDYYNNMGLLRAFAQDMARKGINIFEPDYSQEGGGLTHQTALKLQAGVMQAANALANEYRAETQTRPYELSGAARIKPGVQREGLYYSDPNNFMSTKLPAGVEETNQRLAQETNTLQDQNRANQLLQQQIQRIDNQVNQGLMSREEGEYYKQQLVPNAYRTQLFSPRGDYGSGAASGISAYVKKWSEIANGIGFEPGETFDAQGNRIDVARPSEFSNRQLGFTKDGQKFIIDHFEKALQPNGDFVVEAVDATGKNRAAVDPNNIVGSLRSFIETNEGAGALKDLNNYFRSQGFDTATDSVPAGLYAKRNLDSTQSSTAPQVTKARNRISTYLDMLAEPGLMTSLKNSFSAYIKNYANIKPTEVEYTTKDGRTLIIERDGDGYKVANYRDIFGKPDKSGVININGKKTPVVGTFEKVPKATMQAMLEKFGVVNVLMKDADGKEVANEPITKSIKSSDIPTKAAAAGYTPEEYRELLQQRGVQIVE